MSSYPLSIGRGLIIAVVAAMIMPGCVEIPRVTPEFVAVATLRDATTTAEQLDVGRSIYVNRCSSCHSLYAPDAYSEREWTSWVHRMASKSHIDRNQETTLLGFLFAARDMAIHSTKP